MARVIALVGRPNVGKSTLFNSLTGTRDALVADFPGLTRDRQYGFGHSGGERFIVVDTGGLSGDNAVIDRLMAEQTEYAIAEADHVLLLVDGREGRTGSDESIAQRLRTFDKPVSLVVNKTDGVDPDQACADFYGLGVPSVYPIAAVHGRGVTGLIETVLRELPDDEMPFDAESTPTPRIRVAFVGRPNVGKSTLINRLLGESRVLASDKPGTTRDSIEIPFERDDQHYTLIDTAGVRRRSRVKLVVEKYSVIKSLQAIDRAHVVVALVDARDGIAEQDASLLGLVLEAGRSIVLAINKWDGLSHSQKDTARRELERRLSFIDFVERRYISALHGTGVGKLMTSVNIVHHAASRSFSTPVLTELLEQAQAAHAPPLVRGRRIKLRYAHQGGRNPPRVVIHGNQTAHVPGSYKRYLMNFYRDKLKLTGTPVRLEFVTSDNPYAGRRNTLTPRQRRKRERVIKSKRS
ncbi:MAG: ribosome biogenesis GTPase Der [Gammaproteobacteria bacterium]